MEAEGKLYKEILVEANFHEQTFRFAFLGGWGGVKFNNKKITRQSYPLLVFQPSTPQILNVGYTKGSKAALGEHYH